MRSEERTSEVVEKLVAAQRAARAVERSASALWTELIAAADSAVTNQSLEDVYRDALSTVREVLDADSVAILLANESEDQLVARASIGLGENRTVGLRIGAGEGMAGRVLASRAPMIVDDLSDVALVSPALREHGLRSVVAVPIISETRVLGVLHVASTELAHFTRADADLLEFLSDRLALALDRVRLFELHRQLAEMGSFLAETAKIMAEASDLTEVLHRLADAALPALGDICLVDVLEDGRLSRLVARHKDPSQQPLVDRLRTEFPPEISGGHPAVRVMRSGEASWAPSMSDEFLRSTTRDEEHYALTKALRFRSYLAVPIESEDSIIGTLTIVSCSRSFGERDVEFSRALAQQVGSVVGNAQQLDFAAKTSHILQAALLPRALPKVPGLVVCNRYEAASQSLDVGGDFYDLMLMPDATAWFMIGDVEGHDQGAAALMGKLRSASRVLASQGLRPSELIAHLQSIWELMDFDRIATALFGRIDPADGQLTLASAGHSPPLLMRDGTAEFLPVPPSPPLGSTLSTPASWDGRLDVDEVLLLYTDGVTSERELGVERGMERLVRAVLDGDPTLDEICERVVSIDPAHEDDIALLGLQRTPVEDCRLA